MQVKHNKTLIQSQNGLARIHAMCWSPNNMRLAVADNSRYINVFDELGERRERFSARAADGKGKAFVIRGMVFSPDNTKLAIAQSDNVVLVCRLGLEWGEKKKYCNNFVVKDSVTCVAWPSTGQGTDFVVFGMQDGNVRVGIIKTNKSQSLYTHEHTVIALTTSSDGNTVYSGHADGSILKYVFEGGEEGQAGGAQKFAMHPSPPHVLSIGEHLCAAGSDCIVSFYDKTGQRLQQFDYPVEEEHGFTVGKCNPSGQSIAIAAYNKVRLFNYNLRARKWEEGTIVPLPNAGSITSLTWKHDGSRLITGTLTGAVDEFDTCLKRYRIRNAFEFTYVSHNQVIVKRLATGARIVLRSNQGAEIQRVNVYKDKYLVANTASSLMVGDLVSCKLSEVPWQISGREKFVFDNPKVCMVFAVGELCLIEYGKNEILGTCRTEASNMHRISVRIHDAPEEPEDGSLEPAIPERKCVAYLIDRLTIQVNDLLSGTALARITHTCKIDWLELNHRANRLLYRDKEHQLFLFDIATQQRTTLLNYCSYVQWVPDSDVAVAQNRGDLCVWYNIDSPDLVTVVPIKGEVEGIERGNGKTEVIVDEGVHTIGYALDEALIEFGTAMEDHNYDRACDLLDKIPLTPETTAMWQNLSTVAIQEMKLLTAERCFAALGDVAKVRELHRINELAEEAAKASDGLTNGYDHYTVQAELCMLNKDFHVAEQIFLENGKEDSAMAMWEEMNCFDNSIAIAEARGNPDLANKRARYYNWLMETAQYEKAGEIREKEGRHMDAISLYLRGGTPARAANVVSTANLRPEQQLLEAIAAALFKAQVFEKAGDFFEKLKMDDRAIDAYRRGHVYSRAIEFVKRAHPDRVVALEEEWGDYLVSQRQVDQAINHYMEAHQYHKAVTAAIKSRQWTKAVSILETQNVGADTDEKVKDFYKQVAQHYQEASQYSEAEKYFLKAGAISDAVEMYNRAGMQDQMYRVAQRYLSQDKLVELFVEQAEKLVTKGDYSGAERIYIKVEQPDRAIGMYKKARDFTNMIRLVQAYRPEFLLKAHISLAVQFEKENNLKLAETHYVAGKEWSRAVNMYRDRDMWDDAVRVAKVHGGVNASKQVVLARAMAIEADEGVRLLLKFSLVEAGIDAAVSAQKFDVALQWAQLAQPAKLPFVYLKYAMHYEDQGDFRMAEDAFVKSGKPREAIDMYIHQQDYSSAMRVAEAHDQSAIPSICIANGRVCFQRGNYQEAETLLLRANAPETLLKLYMDARMFTDAQRIAKEHSPSMLGEIAKRIALQSNDPHKAGVVLEENGEFALAIDTYLGATKETVPDENTLVNLWVRAVKVAQNHSRNTLKDVLTSVTTKLKDAHRYIEAGKCFEDCKDYKAAINMYVQGKKFDLAENLAKRISPELEDYVKRAIVQSSIEGGGVKDARAIEDMDPDAALKTYISNNDWENAMRLVKRKSKDEQLYTAGLEVQYYLREGKMDKVLIAVGKNDFEPDDFRFFGMWVQLAEKLVALLPSDEIDLTKFHMILSKTVSGMDRSGQKPEDVQKGKALLHVIHAYHIAPILKENGLEEFATQVMLGLPRWVPYIPADKAYFDAGVAAKNGGKESIAFVFLNRYLDIREHIEDGKENSSGISPGEFALTDFPAQYPLPRKVNVSDADSEEINKWVLALSIKPNLDAHLPTVLDPKDNQTKMFEGSLKSPAGTKYEECAVNGYPILSGFMVRCQSCQRPANQENWNRFVMQMKMCPWCKVECAPNFKM